MEALKTIYNNIPPSIPVPAKFIHKKGEVIFIIDDTVEKDKKISLKTFYGTIPDFPERKTQGKYEERESL